MLSKVFSFIAISLFLTGCGFPQNEDSDADATHRDSRILSHPDFPDDFDRNYIMSDSFFTNKNFLDINGIQKFLEKTPYNSNRRSFLADEILRNGQTVAEAVYHIAQKNQLNPVALLARMQIEKSLINRSSSPGGDAVDFAFGCGCPDSRLCKEEFRGLEKQIQCAAETYRKWYDQSLVGKGPYKKGRNKSSKDGLVVNPVNHATASLYAYTPWVRENSSGNWLVWLVTRLYAVHSDDLGVSKPELTQITKSE